MLPRLPDFEPQPPWENLWSLDSEQIYFNHGSFGPSPLPVQETHHQIQRLIESQPARFFFRSREQYLQYATIRLSQYLGIKEDNLLLVKNSTEAMNLVAHSFPLEPEDEILLTNHEYGAVQNIWRHTCQIQGARFGMAELPLPVTDADQIVEALFSRVTRKTKLIVVSHVTSPTSLTLPVKKICDRARTLGIPVCVDGPHALLMQPLALKEMGCQFYTASCHKWLSAPFGTGFLYVRGEAKSNLQPLINSWGRSLSGNPPHWKDPFMWQGTANDAPLLTLPATLDFWNKIGEETFRKYTSELIHYARERLQNLFPFEPLAPDSDEWTTSMISVPIGSAPENDKHIGKPDPLQERLLERYGIEIPVIHWNGLKLLRLSIHLYNSRQQVDRLVEALKELRTEDR